MPNDVIKGFPWHTKCSYFVYTAAHQWHCHSLSEGWHSQTVQYWLPWQPLLLTQHFHLLDSMKKQFQSLGLQKDKSYLSSHWKLAIQCVNEAQELVASKSTYSCILIVLGQYECSDSDWGEKMISSPNSALQRHMFMQMVRVCWCWHWTIVHMLDPVASSVNNKVYTKWLQSVNTLLYWRMYWSLLTWRVYMAT